MMRSLGSISKSMNIIEALEPIVNKIGTIPLLPR